MAGGRARENGRGRATSEKRGGEEVEGDLIVQVPCEPIIERSYLHVAGGGELEETASRDAPLPRTC
eukprot:760355-Hanusia_phi.AAC.1